MAPEYDDYLLDGVPRVEMTDWEDVAAFLDQSQAQRQERLDDQLTAIEEQLADRDQIHQEIVANLERQIDRYVDRLGRTSARDARDRITQRLEEFYQKLRDEHRAHWRDRQQLERERREITRELAESETSLADLVESL